jgi:YgiT-type zinc finger domain-containing protein
MNKCECCGGEVTSIEMKGKYFKHRGQEVRISDSFKIRTCSSCGEQFLNYDEARELTVLLDNA